MSTTKAAAIELAEVEITGVLNAADVARLRRLVEGWNSVGRLDRYLINFTTAAMRERRLDVRARVTNGVPEMVVKHGEWGSGNRVETNVKCQPDQFHALVKAMVAMGLTEGIGCHRVIDRYRQDDLEISIIEVPGYKTFYEAEVEVPKDSADAALQRLRLWAKDNSFPVMDKAEYLAFIDDLDANANDTLSFSNRESWELLTLRVPDGDKRPIN